MIDFNKKNTLKIDSNFAKLRNWPDVTILVIHGVRLDLGSVKRSVMGSVMGSVVGSVIEPAMGSEMASVMTFVTGSVRGSVMGSVMGLNVQVMGLLIWMVVGLSNLSKVKF